MPNSNFEKLHTTIEPEATPEQEAEMITQRDLLSKKLTAINEALAKLSHKKSENGFEKHQEDQQRLSDTMGTIAQALSQENLQKIYAEREKSETVLTPTQPVPPVEINSYDAYLADNEKLADVMGNAANALSQENLKKIYPAESEPAPAIITPPTPAPASENPEPAPVPAPAPTKTPEQLLAEKIRRGESLTPEDYLLRKDKWSGPGGVAKELENLATAPDSQEAHNFIEHTGPNLERSRKDYVLAIFNNRKALYENKQWKDSGNGVESETLDPANQEYLKILQKKYNDNIDAELAQITVAENPEGGKRLAMTKARLEFLENERNTFNNELFMLENEETKKRINRALDKAFSKAGEFIGNAGAFAGKKINNILDRFKNKQGRKKGDGMPGWYYAAMVPVSVVGIGVFGGKVLYKGALDSIAMLKEKFNKTMNPEKKEGGLKEKYGNKKPSAEPIPGKPLDKTQEQFEKEKKLKEVEARKKEFLEKVTGVELTGRNLDNWKKLGIVHVGKFFNLSRFKKPTELEKQKTYPMQQKIYAALLPAYQEAERTSKLDRTKDIKGTDKLSMEEFITKLAEQDKLKALWTKASSNNS